MTANERVINSNELFRAKEMKYSFRNRHSSSPSSKIAEFHDIPMFYCLSLILGKTTIFPVGIVESWNK